MKPADAGLESFPPIKVSRFKPGSRFIGAVVKYHRRTNPIPPVAVHCGDVWTAHPIMVKPRVIGFDAHFPHPVLYQLADGIFHHSGSDPGLQSKAIRKTGSDIILSPGPMD